MFSSTYSYDTLRNMIQINFAHWREGGCVSHRAVGPEIQGVTFSQHWKFV